MILLVDNYDSFVHNLARYFQRLGQATKVVRNDAIDASTVLELRPRAVVLSPGPCTPSEAGCCVEVVQRLVGVLPILGVCLGHQSIGAAFGARIVRTAPVHGRSSRVLHDGHGAFRDLPNPMTVARYHSLTIDEDTLPRDFEVSARTTQKEVMAIRHREHPVVGAQFHPESILTDGGFHLLANFLALTGATLPRAKLPSEVGCASSFASTTQPLDGLTF